MSKKESKKLKREFYEFKGEQLDRIRQYCPKCGPGIFMGEHKDRQTCGKCSYTKWKETQ